MEKAECNATRVEAKDICREIARRKVKEKVVLEVEKQKVTQAEKVTEAMEKVTPQKAMEEKVMEKLEDMEATPKGKERKEMEKDQRQVAGYAEVHTMHRAARKQEREEA